MQEGTNNLKLTFFKKKKNYSRDIIRWRDVLAYILLKNIVIEIAKREHIGSVEVLVYLKYSHCPPRLVPPCNISWKSWCNLFKIFIPT